MSEQLKIDGWWAYLRAVLLRPTWEILTTGVVFTFLSVTTWWRDNFASEDWKKRLELRGLLPRWHPAIWVCIGLIVLLMVVVRRAFWLWQQQDSALAAYRAKPMPEFVIDLAKEGDDVVGVKIRNVWSQNLYNIAIAGIKSRVGEISWWENFFPCLEAGVGEKILRPCSFPGGIARFQDLPGLKSALQEIPGGDNPEHVGDIVIWAEDAAGIGFRFSTRLELWNKWTWRVWDTERVYAKPSKGQ